MTNTEFLQTVLDDKKQAKEQSIMRSIPVPMIIWLPALVWFVTYELTKFHGIKGWLKANTDFYGATTDDEVKGRK